MRVNGKPLSAAGQQDSVPSQGAKAGKWWVNEETAKAALLPPGPAELPLQSRKQKLLRVTTSQEAKP